MKQRLHRHPAKWEESQETWPCDVLMFTSASVRYVLGHAKIRYLQVLVTFTFDWGVVNGLQHQTSFIWYVCTYMGSLKWVFKNGHCKFRTTYQPNPRVCEPRLSHWASDASNLKVESRVHPIWRMRRWFFYFKFSRPLRLFKRRRGRENLLKVEKSKATPNGIVVSRVLWLQKEGR